MTPTNPILANVPILYPPKMGMGILARNKLISLMIKTLCVKYLRLHLHINDSYSNKRKKLETFLSSLLHLISGEELFQGE